MIKKCCVPFSVLLRPGIKGLNEFCFVYLNLSQTTFLEPSLQQQSQVLQQEPISIRCLKSSLEEVQ